MGLRLLGMRFLVLMFVGGGKVGLVKSIHSMVTSSCTASGVLTPLVGQRSTSRPTQKKSVRRPGGRSLVVLGILL